jgi:heme-degrading monooxygenase HmoA
MVIEHAILSVKPGETIDFEKAFIQAICLLEASPGCRSARLERSLEVEHRYQLVVEWDSLEAHTNEFRNSALYARFRDLLIPFYDAKPDVEHYEILQLSGE